MSEGLANCEFKLLTTSKDVGLRRWRSFTAALGASGQIFHEINDLLLQLSTRRPNSCVPIVIYDQTLALSPQDLSRLQACCRLFILRPSSVFSDISVPLPMAPAWAAEAYLQCSLNALLDSPIVRTSLGRLAIGGQGFKTNHLLRWGYAAQSCSANNSELNRVSLAFSRSLNLRGEARSLTEMFTHFVLTRLGSLGLRNELVTFGFDGILTLVSARCAILADMDVQAVAAELRIHQIQITMTNRLAGNYLEIAGLCHQQTSRAENAERMLLVFNKKHHTTALTQAESDQASTEASIYPPHKAS